MTLHVLGEGQRDGVGAVHCRAVVLASGGLGQVFSQSTNPSVSTGDGMALALRAGATLRDLEFVQFHPTVMYLGPDSQGQQPLISEAVRGEGAFLVDFEGARFMQGQHELADLAPRDVVAKAITRRMIETGRPHMWLDARHLGGRRSGSGGSPRSSPSAASTASTRRPTSSRSPRPSTTPRAGSPPTCTAAATSPASTPPARSPAPGVHGANRLASNSLLEGLVFSRRIAAVLPGELRPWADPVADDPRPDGLVAGDRRRRLQEEMTTRVGVLRSADGITEALEGLAALGSDGDEAPGVDGWETTNLLSLSTALARAALLREETRGSHWREDFPERDDDAWAGHVDSRLVDGVLHQEFVPAPSTDPSTPTVEPR